MTANAMTHQVVEYQAAGIDGVVAKPVDMTNLFNAMEEALSRVSATAEAGQQNAAS